MKTRLLILGVFIASVLSLLSFTIYVEYNKKSDVSPDNIQENSIKQLPNGDTSCETFWRKELLEMQDTPEYDYTIDPTFKECLEMQQAKDTCELMVTFG